jgi:DNA-binding CsgD family transcriptional regulator
MSSTSATNRKQDSRPPLRSEQARDELVKLIYRGPLEPQPWQSFVNNLREVMDALALSIVLYPNNSERLETRVLATDPDHDIDWIALNQRYIHEYLEGDPTASDKIAPGQILNIRDFQDSPYFTEFLQPLGIEHALRMGFSESGGMRCWLAASRSQRMGPFDDADIKLLQDLLPHLEQALALYASIMLSQSEKILYNEAIAHLAFGSILLNGERRIISANPIAHAIIERHPELRVNDAMLSLGDATANAELQGAINAAIAGRDNDGRGAVELVRVECRSGNLLGLLIRPTPPQPYYRGASTPHVVIYLSDLEQHIEGWNHSQREPQQLIAKLFKLTQAESRLALLLADGKTLAAAAVAMHITEKTARNHSKNIYDKTGIKRQVDLVRLIYKSVALLG